MADPSSVAGFFEAEWARFWQGYANLSPEKQLELEQQRAKSRAKSGQQNTVSLPGWDSVIHLTPAYQPTAAERTEYYAARSQRRNANLSAEAITAIENRRASAARIASSSAPGYAQAWGQMLTALDNVQDFMTTVATLGRLALYPAISAVDAALPRFAAEGWARSIFGATPEAAETIAQLAAKQAASEAYLAARAASLAEYAAAAGAGLERSALLAAGRESAELAAGAAARLAYREALTKAGAGVGSKLLGRLIPGLGYVLIASDLLNLLSLLGQVGMIGYSATCFGGRAGLAAAAPLAALRGLGAAGPCGVKGKLSKIADLNPWSQESRALRRMKLGRGAPGLGALLETFQTTDQLYGVGLSFGSIVGAITEGAYAAELNSRGERVSVLPPASALSTIGVGTGVVALQLKSKALGALAAGSLLADIVGRTATAPLRKKHQAAQQLQTAPAFNATQETFTEYEHVEQLVSYAHALDLVASDLATVPWQDWVAAQLPIQLAPPQWFDPLSLHIIAESDPTFSTLGVWPVPGNPTELSSDEFTAHYMREIPSGVRQLLEPRRNTAVGMFCGGMVNFLAERTLAMLEPEPGFLETRWRPDWRFLLAHAETARIVNVNTDPDRLWSWWLDGINLAEQKQLQEIGADDLDQLAAKHAIPLFHVEEAFLRLPLQ